MNRSIPLLGLVAVLGCRPAPPATATVSTAALVETVRAAGASQDFSRGENIINQYQSTNGTTPDSIEARSWLARTALQGKQFDRADRYATETYSLATAALKTRRLDDDPHLQTALGAAIETQALVQVQRGARSDAVQLLEQELNKYRDTAIHKRLAKNLNLLSLEGQPAPALDADEYLDQPVPDFPRLRGKVVLLFFWAHWCPDCKAESPILARLLEKYRSRGLVIVAPTQRYGYVANGETAPPDVELRYIVQIRDQYYGFLRGQPVPVSEANHKRYGVASTPTIVLLDRQGIVRRYHPGSMTEADLDSSISALVGS